MSAYFSRVRNVIERIPSFSMFRTTHLFVDGGLAWRRVVAFVLSRDTSTPGFRELLPRCVKKHRLVATTVRIAPILERERAWAWA